MVWYSGSSTSPSPNAPPSKPEPHTEILPELDPRLTKVAESSAGKIPTQPCEPRLVIASGNTLADQVQAGIGRWGCTPHPLAGLDWAGLSPPLLGIWDCLCMFGDGSGQVAGPARWRVTI